MQHTEDRKSDVDLMNKFRLNWFVGDYHIDVDVAELMKMAEVAHPWPSALLRIALYGYTYVHLKLQTTRMDGLVRHVSRLFVLSRINPLLPMLFPAHRNI